MTLNAFSTIWFMTFLHFKNDYKKLSPYKGETNLFVMEQVTQGHW